MNTIIDLALMLYISVENASLNDRQPRSECSVRITSYSFSCVQFTSMLNTYTVFLFLVGSTRGKKIRFLDGVIPWECYKENHYVHVRYNTFQKD